MKRFRDYDILYPELILDILEYFDVSNGDINTKTVYNFCHQYRGGPIEESPQVQPNTIVKICEKLYDNDILSVNSRGGLLGMNNNYSFAIRNRDFWITNRRKLCHYYSSLVYGFEFIYNSYRDKVLPIIAYNDDQQSMGSCFKYLNGIITARHCLVDGQKISIRGIPAEELNKANVYISKNPDIDVAYIELGIPVEMWGDDPIVLDEILVMGYPMIPRFLNFCTAERATISTIADLRMTPSRGVITALAGEIFTAKDTLLMLITARIKGGNSGGPVINKNGSVIGVAVSDPIGEGNNYDDLGYGIAYPIGIISNILNDRELLKVDFIDFAE